MALEHRIQHSEDMEAIIRENGIIEAMTRIYMYTARYAEPAAYMDYEVFIPPVDYWPERVQ